jgi:hypothetical protein
MIVPGDASSIGIRIHARTHAEERGAARHTAHTCTCLDLAGGWDDDGHDAADVMAKTRETRRDEGEMARCASDGDDDDDDDDHDDEHHHDDDDDDEDDEF